MFEVPNAKRVCRQDLYASRSASPASAGSGDGQDDGRLLRDRLNAALDIDLAFDNPDLDTQLSAQESENLQAEAEEEKDEGFTFNLFAPSRASAQVQIEKPQRIHLSPTLDSQKFSQKRPDSYYFASAPSSAAVAAYNQSAVSFTDVLERAAQPWPESTFFAARFPQRVLRCAAHPSLGLASAVLSTLEAKGEQRRTRVGKKTRIKRRKAAARRAQKETEKIRKEEDERKKAEEKEEHIKNKKRELNRKKQLRKREKKRAAGEADLPGEEARGADSEDGNSNEEK